LECVQVDEDSAMGVYSRYDVYVYVSDYVVFFFKQKTAYEIQV